MNAYVVLRVLVLISYIIHISLLGYGVAIILTKKVMHYSAHVIDWNDITMSVPGTTCRYQVPGTRYEISRACV